jgi:hypothetical protein
VRRRWGLASEVLAEIEAPLTLCAVRGETMSSQVSPNTITQFTLSVHYDVQQQYVLYIEVQSNVTTESLNVSSHRNP